MAERLEQDQPNKIHEYVTWPETRRIFADGRGGLAFPSQNNSECRVEDESLVSNPGQPRTMSLETGVTYLDPPEEIHLSDIDYQPSYPVNLESNRIGFTIISFNYDKETGKGTVRLSDQISYDMIDPDGTVSFVATTPDTLELTTIIQDITIEPWVDSTDEIQFDATIDYSFIWSNTITFEMLVPVNDGTIVYLCHQDNAVENGVYRLEDGVFQKLADYPTRTVSEGGETPDEVLNDPTVNDNVECCDHFRKNYSHREVYERVNYLNGDVIKFGVKSMSPMDCDGGLVDWFLNSGDVNLGNGHESVFVSGFGLGTVYQADPELIEQEVKLPTDDYDEYDGTLHPLLESAYGTRYDAITPGGESALPKDWPFTNFSSGTVFNRVTDTNNITLVKHCDENVGNLERDVEDPDTHTTHHVFNNKHHIVLYPEYTAISGSNDYKDGSVVVKPLFIHLPATLDTKDGETVEITVSIQNVDQNAFGDAGSAAALSGYYAAMSQPRVYVMGGVQKFSNKKMHIDKDSIVGTPGVGFSLSTDTPAYENNKVDLLTAPISVRANILVAKRNGVGSAKTFTAHGTMTSNDANGASFMFDGDFPYSRTDAIWRLLDFSICGMAYLETGDNPSSTPMGLVSRSEDLLRDDMGKGSSGDLDEYNKFYSIKDDSPRTQVPYMDKRYVLATVYQTDTSTFPWSLTNRRKMTTLHRSWTDDIHRSKSSVLKMVYDQNAEFAKVLRNDILSGYFDDTHDIRSDESPLMYAKDMSGWKSLGSAIRVSFPSNYSDDAIVEADGNPVRQARKAVSNLASDLMHMRILSYSDGKKARVKVTGISTQYNGNWPPSDGDTIVGSDSTPSSYTEQWKTDLVQSIWCSKVRSLPDYVTKVDTYPSTSKYYMPSMNIFDANWTAYVSDPEFPYNKECKKSNDADMYSSASTIENGSIVGTTETSVKCNKYSQNSLIRILDKSKKLSDDRVYRVAFYNACRYAETVLAVKINDADYLNLGHLDKVNDGSSWDYDDEQRLLKDWMNPFTTIQSVDSVPVPVLDDDISVQNHIYNSLSAAQHEFVSSDAVQMYRYEAADSDDQINTVSTVMPTDSALGNFIEAYVAAYGSKMPTHVYQGSRVLLRRGTLDNHDIYVKRIDRIYKRFGSDIESYEHYIADNFATISASSSTRDPNADYATVDVPSISMSQPPYTTSRRWSNETYTRVIMQFTFSQKAGRWYTTGYRQYPTNYLSPLYGADALGTQMPSMYDVNGNNTMKIQYGQLTYDSDVVMPLWTDSMCNGLTSYRPQMYMPYSLVPPMDMTLGCVPFMTGNYDSTVFAPYTDDTRGWTVGQLKPEYATGHDSVDLESLKLLEEPFKPLTSNGSGGLNLYPPSNVHGGYSVDTDASLHANFWSVRKFIRPAVSVLNGTDVPGCDDPTDPTAGQTGGRLSDATLYRMFDFPVSGERTYKLLDVTDPEIDNNKNYLMYQTVGDSAEYGQLVNGDGSYLVYGIAKNN